MSIFSKEYYDSKAKSHFSTRNIPLCISSLCEKIIAVLWENMCIEKRITSNNTKEKPNSLTDFFDFHEKINEAIHNSSLTDIISFQGSPYNHQSLVKLNFCCFIRRIIKVRNIRRKHWVKWEISRSPPVSLTLKNKQFSLIF